MRTETESVELKTTTKDSYSVKASELAEMYRNALLDGARISWLEIEFANRGITAVVMLKDDFLTMRERATSE